MPSDGAKPTSERTTRAAANGASGGGAPREGGAGGTAGGGAGVAGGVAGGLGGIGGVGGATTEDDAIDRGLIEGIKQGRPGAWNDLVRRYQDRIYSVCLKLTSNRDLAADLAQDTMVKLVQHIDRYDGRCLFSTWVYRVTFNTCLTRLRAEKLRRMAPLDGEGNVELRSSDQDGERRGGRAGPGGGGGRGGGGTGSGGLGVRSVGTAGGGGAERELGGAERVEYGEARRALQEAVERLAPEHASVLILRDAHGLEYQQIADALEISVGTVKSRLFRARAALRDLMEGGEPKD